MKVEIVGYNCSKIEAIKAYRDIIPTGKTLVEIKKVIDNLPIKKELPEKQVELLIERGFRIANRTEINELMNQLIQKFLAIGDKKRAKKLIAMWLELIEEEDNV